MWKRIAVVGLAATLAVGCANAPIRVWEMDEAALQQVPQRDLCNAVAVAAKYQEWAPKAEAEVERRGISCAAELQEAVSDCSKLTILNPDAEPTRDTSVPYSAYTPTTPDVVFYFVENRSSVPMNYRISWDMTLSTLQSVKAGETGSYAMHVPQLAGREAKMQMSRNAGRTIRPALQDCTVVRGYGRSPGGAIPW